MTANKPVILLYGNCHPLSLHTLMTNIPAFEDFDVRYLASYEWENSFPPIDPELLRHVVLLFDQAHQGKTSDHRAQLYAALPAGVPAVRFPPLDCLALFPFIGHDPRKVPEPPRYPNGRYAWSDTMAASLAEFAHLPDEDLFNMYMERSVAGMPDLHRRLEIDEARMRARDNLADIKIADWLLDNFRRRPVFYTMGHTSGAPLRYLLDELVGASRDVHGVEVATMNQQIDAWIDRVGGWDGVDWDQTPIHPMVVETYGLEYCPPDRVYKFFDNRWTFREYTLNYIRWADR